NGQLELSEPVDWPDGLLVKVIPLPADSLAYGSTDEPESPAPLKHWPVGFFTQIREQWGEGPLERPLQGEFEQREDW
ncbi:MAG: hypothetical protein ABI557_20940, partial [Aureliella sp.]